MQRRAVLFICLLATVGMAALLVDGGIEINVPNDLKERVSESCNSSCVNSCNATWTKMADFLKKMSDDNAKKCDVCAMSYYAQDLNVEVGKCPCKQLEKFRKLSRDEDIVPEEECVDCCLEWAMDAITYEEDCKDPSDMKPKDTDDEDSGKGAYRNACGFTVKTAAAEAEEEMEKEKEKEKEEEEKKKKEEEEEEKKKKEEEEEEEKEDKDDGDYVVSDGTYDYESLGSQFDTCKCICKGLPPCKAPADAETEGNSDEGTDASTVSSFFNSAAMGGGMSSTESVDDILSTILP